MSVVLPGFEKPMKRYLVFGADRYEGKEYAGSYASVEAASKECWGFDECEILDRIEGVWVEPLKEPPPKPRYCAHENVNVTQTMAGIPDRYVGKCGDCLKDLMGYRDPLGEVSWSDDIIPGPPEPK